MGAAPKTNPPRTVEQLQADRLNLGTALRRAMGQLDSALRTGNVPPAAREVSGMAQRALKQAGLE